MKDLASTYSGNSAYYCSIRENYPWGKSDGSSLLDHIQDCMDIFTSIKILIPLLPITSRIDNFWDLLFWALLFHDIGKLHPEFQKVLQSKKNLWELQRHELYAIPFIALADEGRISKTDIKLISQAVLAHHKDFKTLGEKFKPEWLLDMELDVEKRYQELGYHPADFAKGVERIIQSPHWIPFWDGIHDLAQKLGFSAPCSFISITDVPLNDCHPFEAIAKAYKEPTPQTDIYWQQMMLWGSLKICDHYGSARIKKIYQLTDDHFAFLDRLKTKYGRLYNHQESCAVTNGNLMLIAPTGSGKTEAAMAWLKTQLQEYQGRAYYILPYTASINAMHRRLSRDTGAEEEAIVGIQHGKLLDYLYTSMEDEGRPDITTLKNLADQYRKIIYPLKIVTPFQILKYAYGVKGFETGFAHLSGAKLIFDEIHAYDARTFAQLQLFLKYLITHLKCRVMIMTATLPRFMLDTLKNILGIGSEIRADQSFLERQPRHRIVILDGKIGDHIHRIEAALADPAKKILVVCNTVVQAQIIYQVLSPKLDSKERVLLHSRFTSKDRQLNEKKIFSDTIRLLVGTQAIEVSLDIDFHVMFTEPAPMDRLLQRFGRINRNYKHPPCPVHIFNQGGEHDHWIYPNDLVVKTLQCLAQKDLIHEHMVQEMMDEVYRNDWPEKEKKEYLDTLAAFEESITHLYPFSTHREKEEEFYEQFTGVQVLPTALFPEYRTQILQKNFIKADQLLVSLQKAGYRKLRANDQIVFQRIPLISNKDKEENYWVPVAQCRYDENLGMTDEFETFYDNQNFI